MNEREMNEAIKKLPKSIEPPRDLWPAIEARLGEGGRRPSRRWYWVPLAAAAVLALVLLGRSNNAPWNVTALAGRPVLGSRPLTASGRLRVGEWLETDDSSRALIAVGHIGEVAVERDTRIRLVTARPEEHRLALAYGAIAAKVDAEPRLFFVETPAGTAIDLGCAYTLAMDSLGKGRLHVTAGIVEFQTGDRSSKVPIGAMAEIRPRVGPGIPFVEDAPAPLVRALIAFDFEHGGARAARTVLALARPADAVSLWHLLQRVDAPLRGAVYDRLAALVPPPARMSRAAAIALDLDALDQYWSAIHRILFRRMILKGVRVIDPRTGLADTTVRSVP
jgi:hypothetical protein